MNTKKLPVSTRIWNFLVDVFVFCVFILFANPLSMFLLNIFAPRKTCLWAKNSVYFGKTIFGFYNALSAIMPFYWAKWWVEPNDSVRLHKFSLQRQVAYFKKVSSSAETFNALSDDADIVLLKQMSAQEIFDLMPQIRFSTNIWRYLQDSGRHDVLERYIQHGAISSSNLWYLVESVADIRAPYLANIQLLEKYAMRYNLPDLFISKLQQDCACFNRIQRACRCYNQSRNVQMFCGLINAQEEKKWKKFCSENDLEPEAQAQMNLKQYELFATTGQHLHPKAVAILLQKPNVKYWQQIFAHEPMDVFSRPRILMLIKENPSLHKMYKSVTQKKE